MNRRTLLSILGGCCIPWLAVQSQTTITLTPAGAVWKYLDRGTDAGVAWRQPGFDDSIWSSGPAQLGYGDGDEATVVMGGPSSSRFVTTYFRHPFTIPPGTSFSNLTVRVVRDDGAVVYLNGVEVFRSNMPAGNINYLTYASSVVGGSAESQFFAST